MKTLYIHSASGRLMSTMQAPTWKRLARMYGEIMRRNRHLTTRKVETRGNVAHVYVRGA